jgi:CRISPR-associated endonuclease/helicase Cas3
LNEERPYFAHSTSRRDRADWQPLREHLHQVGALARERAAKFGAGDWGYLLGLWHDLGKYDPDFQDYLAALGGRDAHLEAEDEVAGPRRGPEHSIAGAVHAVDRFGDGIGRCLAFPIAGHHAGLADWVDKGSLRERLRRARERDMLGRAKGGAPSLILDLPVPEQAPRDLTPEGLAFWIRMLFSALVDADFLDTEEAIDQERAGQRSRWPSLKQLRDTLDAHLDEKTNSALRDKPGAVNRARADVLASCRRMAERTPGLFTLTVPTGGGKTLASLAFALRHACRHNLDRVIYAIPYTSIIEQTADVFRDVFANLGQAVVEHHSNLAPQRETNATRLASENWDAPIVVTTTVQLFESLYAARPSRCRKLHNLVKSVIVLDEAQLLPPAHLRPILFALDELMGRYATSVVLSTATQPALRKREGFKGLEACAWELAPEPEALRRRLRRVRVERLHNLDRPVLWDELARHLSEESRVLCIVDRRDAARDLHALLPKGTFHLSALMCPSHRSEVLAAIRSALAEAGLPVRVVATQLVEAGVDLDFPVVYRAIAGLDSIAQAAGRCNREGQLSELGRVVVFRAPRPPPKGLLSMAASIGDKLLREDVDDPLTLDAFERYFRDLYWSKRDLDEGGILSGSNNLLARSDLAFAFRTAAERVRLIEQEQVPVLVHWDEAEKIAAQLRAVAAAGHSLRGVMRRAQRYIVGVYPRTAAGLVQAGVASELVPGLLQLDDRRLYDDVTGLRADKLSVYAPEELIL